MANALISKDSMRSTWRRTNRGEWTIAHKILDFAKIHHIELDEPVPIHTKDEKIPYLPDWQFQRYIILHTSIPLILHELYIRLTGSNVGPVITWVFYYLCARLAATKEMRIFRRLGHQYGFLDGDKHERDGVPDSRVGETLASILLAGTMRPLFMISLTYLRERAPSDVNFIVLPVQIGIYGIVLDFWFYWYHRLMHEVEGLWKFHRTHHLTKHPNPLLTLFADHEQEFFDIAGIPLLTFYTMKMLGFPMGFYEWFCCQQFVSFAELAGHSGLRLYAAVPNPLTWLLRLFDAELNVEDHDLHHRRGWKKSCNYGKQTRLWDKIFGTTGQRIESVWSNVDFETRAVMPLS